MNDNQEIDLTNPTEVFNRLAQLQLRHDAREAAIREFQAQQEQDEAEWDGLAQIAAAMLPDNKAVHVSAHDYLSWRNVQFAVTYDDGLIAVREMLQPYQIAAIRPDAPSVLSDDSPDDAPAELFLPSYKRINPDVDAVSINGEAS